jgi:tyrosyl-tRNA synthetase
MVFSLTPEQQLAELKKGTVDFVNEHELLKKLKKSYDSSKPLRIKAGFDPSRPDLHLGHAVLINKLKQFQDIGHHVIFLIGDFTAMIGDPTGKNETRPALSEIEIEANSKTYARQVFKILDPKKTEVSYNNNWFKKFSSSEFIKLSSQYTVARMLERDDFSKRFKNQESISLHEFLYPLVQGYDSVALKADVECGGTDQLFNLLVGRDMQKSYGQEQQCVVTVPILEGLDGINKMSKSLDNYIALEDSPTEMFGKTMRLSDPLMIRFYELLTDLTVNELETLKKDLKDGIVHPKKAKVDLAKFFVERFHGVQQAKDAEEEFERIFKKKGLPDEVPLILLKAQSELWVCHLLTQTQLATSTSEARRLITGGAVEMDGSKITDPQLKVNLKPESEIMLKAGKKKFAKVQVTS